MQCSLNFVKAVESRLKSGTCSTNGSVVLILSFRQDRKFCLRKALFLPTILRNMLVRMQILLVLEHLVPIIATVHKMVN